MDWWLSGWRRLSWKQIYISISWVRIPLNPKFEEGGIRTHEGTCQQIYSLSPFPLSHFFLRCQWCRRSGSRTHINGFEGHRSNPLNYSSTISIGRNWTYNLRIMIPLFCLLNYYAFCFISRSGIEPPALRFSV